MKLQKWMCMAALLFLTMGLQAAKLKGVVIDKAANEPLIGATVQIEGTTLGAVTDIDGRFEFPDLEAGQYVLIAKYISYVTQRIEVNLGESDQEVSIQMATDDRQIDEVTVVARKNLEGERALLQERQMATVAVENIGAKEMSIKGISTVEEGVKKITGVSIAQAGQLIVRGLGDRYSTTTLNGLPIASPNPDNKLIPLDLFPTSTVKNITVSKVYEASAFADYSGAHIDISTKEQTGEDFFNLSFNVGGRFNTMGGDFYQMDRNGTLFKTPSLDSDLRDMALTDFEAYARHNQLFDTNFDVDKKTALPEFGGNIGVGKNFDIQGNNLSILASLGVSNDLQTMQDASVRTLEATGTTLNEFAYDSYATTLKIAGLGSASYTFRTRDMIGYTFFYARNAIDNYMRREGYDYEDHNLVGSNNVTHIYSLQNHQINGKHFLGEDDRWDLNWSGSYSKTGSQEPDRRQMMFLKQDDGSLRLFKLNQQETMRYFGSLDETEWVGNVAAGYQFDEKNNLKFGFTYKDKDRDYMATRFYYDLDGLNPTVTDIYHPSDFFTQADVEAGHVTIDRVQQRRDSYQAGNEIYAGYIQADYYPIASLLVNVGLRLESSKQWVDYYTDGGQAARSELNKNDLFPALNLKYEMPKENNLRFSFSRTITRPSFIEMAPFLYQESYGSAQIRGNADLQNGYNYNLDLRYEQFWANGDMFSVTGYYKYLNDPIERVQTLAGGATVHSFQNADNGLAAGLEVEFRKELVKDLKVGANASFMYTDVKLPEGGAYTNNQRALQGASPYLVNADLTYAPRFGDDRQLSIALLYNLQGPRIHSVGIAGLGDVEQLPVHTLNLAASYQLNSRLSLKLQIDDILNRDVVFEQEVPALDKNVEVERFKNGASFEIGISYNL